MTIVSELTPGKLYFVSIVNSGCVFLETIEASTVKDQINIMMIFINTGDIVMLLDHDPSPNPRYKVMFKDTIGWISDWKNQITLLDGEILNDHIEVYGKSPTYTK